MIAPSDPTSAAEIARLNRENAELREHIAASDQANAISRNLVITQFKEIERVLSLFSKENGLRKGILDAAHQLSVIYCDCQGIIRLYNLGAEALLGYPSEAVLGRMAITELHDPQELVPFSEHQDTPAAVVEALFQAILRHRLPAREWRYRRQDGRLIPVNLSFSIVTDTADQRIGLMCAAMDISDLKAAEDHLKQKNSELESTISTLCRTQQQLLQAEKMASVGQQKFRDFAESASDWLWEMDADLRFSYISERFFEVAAAVPEDVLGRQRWEIAMPEEMASHADAWAAHRQAMSDHLPFRNFEYGFRGRDGSSRRIRITGKPVFDESGAFQGYRGTGSDVTELAQAQNELIRSEKLAALGGLVAGVAHEINTPIGIGLTAASHLQEQTQEFSARYTAGNLRRSDMETYIQRAGEATASLLTNLHRAADLVRSFKQVAVDQSSEQRRRFNLAEYTQEILLSLKPQFKRTTVEVHVDCPADIVIDSIPGAFWQILSNLVINSLLHGFPDNAAGHIRIEARQLGRELILEYRDNGCGMTREVAGKIFQPFFTTRRGQGGSGLGMHVVYNLVTQTLGGRIQFSSAPGQGVWFEMRIPQGETT